MVSKSLHTELGVVHHVNFADLIDLEGLLGAFEDLLEESEGAAITFLKYFSSFTSCGFLLLVENFLKCLLQKQGV